MHFKSKIMLIIIPSTYIDHICGSAMINIYNKVCTEHLNCVGTHSGLRVLIMPVNTTLGHMKLGSFANEVIMIATMAAFSSIGMHSH